MTTPGSSHAPARIVQGLSSGKHIVKIKIVDASVPLEIGSIFTIDSTKATLKGTTFTYTDYTNYTFTLPSGNYDIKYVSGNTIASLPMYEGDGVFNGWVNENGETYSSDTQILPGMVIIPGVDESESSDVIDEDFSSKSDCEFLAPGDLNADGKVDAEDLVMLRQLLLSDLDDNSYTAVYKANGDTAKYSDVNGDGFVDIKDLVRLKKNLAENFEFVANGIMSLNGNGVFTGKFTSALEAGETYEISLTYKSESPITIKLADLNEEIVFDAVSKVSTVTKTFETPINIKDTEDIEFQIIGVGSVDNILVTKVVNGDNDMVDDW